MRMTVSNTLKRILGVETLAARNRTGKLYCVESGATALK
jgi:hypothetical protein